MMPRTSSETFLRYRRACADETKRLLLNVFALDIVDARIQTVRYVINPQKQRHLGPLPDPVTLLRASSGGLGADVP